MGKTLIMIRHAHRDTTQRELDNGLDEKGLEQAKYLRQFAGQRFKAEDFKRGLWLVSSPKLRCRQTLVPLSKPFAQTVDLHRGLDEQGKNESPQAFRERIHAFLREWQQAKVATTILCSHGDWLPLATSLLLGLPHEFRKGSWLELDWEQGLSQLKWYVPSFKGFYS